MVAKKNNTKASTAKSKTAKKPAKAVSKTSAKKTEAKAAPTKKAASKSATKTAAAKKPTASKTAVKAATKKSGDKKAASKTAKVPAKVAAKEAPKKPDVFRCPISGIPVKPDKPNLSDKTLAKLKEILLEERSKLVLQADDLAQEAVALVADREGGDTQFDEESGEGDSIAVERERTLFLSAEALSVVEEIDKALERMKKKSYGLCAPSGRRINVARLEALPWTTVCVDCKARSERPR